MTKQKPESDPVDDENLEDQELGAETDDEQTSAEQSVDLKALSSTVQELSAVVKTLQSEKDRGVQKALKETEDLKDQVEKIVALSKKGLDPDGIAKELGKVGIEERIALLDAKIDQLLGLAPSTLTAAQRKVIEEVGLKEDDQAVTDALSRGLKGDALRAELAMAALKQAKKTVPGASSASPLGAGGGEEKEKFDVTDIEDSDQLYKLAAEKEFGG